MSSSSWVNSTSSFANSWSISSYEGPPEYARSIALAIAVSEATTGSTLKPVRNLMSSIACRFVGSAIATTSAAPDRESGMILCLSQTSRETSLVMSLSSSYSSRLTAGTRYWEERKLVISLSEMYPSFASA